MKERYISGSPSWRKAEESQIVKIAWVVVGVGVLGLMLWGGFFHLEGNLPEQTQQSDYYAAGN